MKERKKKEGLALRAPETGKELIIRIISAIVCFLLLGGVVFALNYEKFTTGEYKTKDGTYEKMRILQVKSEDFTDNDRYENTKVGIQELQIEILSGKYAGSIMTITNQVNALNYNNIFKEGDKGYVLVYENTSKDGTVTPNVSIYSYDRINILIGLVVLFIALIVIIGGKRGLMAILGLIFTILAIFYVLIPLINRGWQAIPTTVLILAVSTLVCFYLLGGLRTKTVCAALGTVGGVMCAALLAALAGELCHISGSNMTEAESLYIYADGYLNVKGLFISGILIAAVGAIMDVAMSIASAVDELHAVNPSLSASQLFKSGMNIGRDAMGTMANTLILAFAGSSLNLIIYIYQIDAQFNFVMNDSNITIEIIRGVAGSIGIILTVPLVAAISAFLISKLGHHTSGKKKEAKK